MARFDNWDFFNHNVQSGLTEGQFLNSGGVLICAGPPVLGIGGRAALGPQDGEAPSLGDTVWPIGLIGQWSLSQQQALVPVAEAGSYKKYTITGPSDGSFVYGRTLYHGPSLLRAQYAYYKTTNARFPVQPLIDDAGANLLRNPHNEISDMPGYENFFINLASSLFSQPVGLLLYFQDVNRESYGAVYLEQFNTGSHGMSSGPGQLVLSEQVQGMFNRARPVKLAEQIPLMSRSSRTNADNDDSGTITTAGSSRTIAGQQRLKVATSANI